MRVQLAAVLALFTFVSAQVLAEETSSSAQGETKMKVEDAKGNKVDGDIDEEITNQKLRAESGSKSKYSMSMSLAYTGGSVSRPFGVERPNLGGLPGTQTVTSVDGTIAARYRATKNDSFTLGVGVGLYTPFHGDVDANDNQFNVYDPSLGYSRAFAAGGLQNIAELGVGIGTSKESRDIDYLTSVSAEYTLLKSWQNGLSFGVASALSYSFYDSEPGENASTAIKQYGGDRRTEWFVALYPFAEYQINDTFSLRTVFGYFRWRHLYGDDEQLRLLKITNYQSVGVGMSVTRDIYLYPNVQFIPEDITSDRTNVALSATINVF